MTQPLTPQEQNLMRVQIENSLNKLSDQSLAENEKEKLSLDLMEYFSSNNEVILMEKEGTKIASHAQMSISRYTQRLKFKKSHSFVKINQVQFNNSGKIKYIEVMM